MFILNMPLLPRMLTVARVLSPRVLPTEAYCRGHVSRLRNGPTGVLGRRPDTCVGNSSVGALRAESRLSYCACHVSNTYTVCVMDIHSLCVYTYIYIYICKWGGREGERERERQRDKWGDKQKEGVVALQVCH